MAGIKTPGKRQELTPRAIRETLGVSHRKQVRQVAGALAEYKRGRRGSERTDDAAIAKAVREDDERTKRGSRGRHGR